MNERLCSFSYRPNLCCISRLPLSSIKEFINSEDDIKTIRKVNAEDVEHIPNSIYIPRVGNSDVNELKSNQAWIETVSYEK